MKHYTNKSGEAIDIIRQCLRDIDPPPEDAYLIGNAIKYLLRAGSKDERPGLDIRKAHNYLHKLVTGGWYTEDLAADWEDEGAPGNQEQPNDRYGGTDLNELKKIGRSSIPTRYNNLKDTLKIRRYNGPADKDVIMVESPEHAARLFGGTAESWEDWFRPNEDGSIPFVPSRFFTKRIEVADPTLCDKCAKCDDSDICRQPGVDSEWRDGVTELGECEHFFPGKVELGEDETKVSYSCNDCVCDASKCNCAWVGSDCPGFILKEGE